MATIFDLKYGGGAGVPSPWRSALLPASFKGARFHCDTNTIESGRRFVEHEFPKKELPYAEDMGRRAKGFTLRGYIIVFPYENQGDSNPLHRLDYRTARDTLRAALETEGIGQLVLPTARNVEYVLCASYKLTEEDQRGGYCTFDMTFMEAGIDWQQMVADTDTTDQLVQAGDDMIQSSIDVLNAMKPLSDITSGSGL